MTDRERIAALEADRDRLRALLVWAYRWVPAVSDVEAVSRDEVEAGRNMIDDELSALPPTGQHEHPDTALLNKLERQKLAGESWTLLERAGGGIPYPVADESRSKAIRYQTAREAIAALKEAERG